VRALYKDIDILSDIKNKTLECVGYVVRRDQGRTVMKIRKYVFESKLDGIEEV
jgi:hypothetical protein